MIDHLGMAYLRSSRYEAMSAVGRIAQNVVRAAVTSFNDVAELVICEEKGTQIISGVGLKPSFSRTLMVF